jgi:predicted lactoylglutathione lyase
MKQIFINLPVADIEKSMDFYTQLGFTINPLFTGENQKCMVWSDQIYVILQTKAFSSAYIKKPFLDVKNFSTASFTIPVESIARVNEMIENGLHAGGKEPVPMLDEGFMFLRTIEDLDGFNWGVMHLDMGAFKALNTIK